MEAQATLNRRQRRQAMKNSNKSHNNRKNEQKIVQLIYSEPLKVLVGRYITDHMLEKAIRSGMTKKKALATYGKNRYRINPNAKITKVITQKIILVEY